jgi:hypothetical protein
MTQREKPPFLRFSVLTRSVSSAVSAVPRLRLYRLLYLSLTVVSWSTTSGFTN